MNETNLERFLTKEEDDVNLRANAQVATAALAQERAHLLQAKVAVKQIQINTALQALQLAVNARDAKSGEPIPVNGDVVERANAVLLAALQDDFYEVSETSG